jgi:hypothetical protein
VRRTFPGTESKVEVKVDLVKALEAANDRITKLPEYTVIEGEVNSEYYIAVGYL